MRRVSVERGFESFRSIARTLLAANVPPNEVLFASPDDSLLLPFGESPPDPAPSPPSRVRAPRPFLEAAERVAHHRDPDRYALLYRLLHRLSHEDAAFLDDLLDSDVRRFRAMDDEIRRELHDAKAYVRFRRTEDERGEHFVAYYRTEHDILPLVAGFFARRFRDMRFSILTPIASLHFDGQIEFGPGASPAEAPASDELEDLFRTYYASTFNPARISLRTMNTHLPKRRQRTLPELRDLDTMVRTASTRMEAMVARETERPSAETFLPVERTLDALADAVRCCRACELCERATQPVFGEGPVDAPLFLVGEQPGDEEDLLGRAFVGPAGQLLERALIDAGIARRDVYLTNAVKHFRFEPRGKRRLHQRPDPRHVAACRPWLEEELDVVQPWTVVCLGRTAARALLGRPTRLEDVRGRLVETPWAKRTLVTYHPSAVLRASSEEARAKLYEALVTDLRLAANRSTP